MEETRAEVGGERPSGIQREQPGTWYSTHSPVPRAAGGREDEVCAQPEGLSPQGWW